MIGQRYAGENWSARRHVRREFSTNHRGRYLGRDGVWNVLSVTFASPDRMRPRSSVVVHGPKILSVTVGLRVRRERKKGEGATRCAGQIKYFIDSSKHPGHRLFRSCFECEEVNAPNRSYPAIIAHYTRRLRNGPADGRLFCKLLRTRNRCTIQPAEIRLLREFNLTYGKH